ncbi:MAG TPA: AAA family ATPase, partial [Candidatus Paceibacterota bacterium]
LNRLIGTFEGGKVGILASLLRERPYGVLLLDEFEKTNKDVHDLFLQVLDEGFFTDVSGKRVNARNLMIIATSNAGSDIIWQSLQEGKALDKDRVITEIINRGIFKPEFLNRFDGVILFHPLGAEHLRVIARLQLQKLAKRLAEKGLELVITDSLLDYLVSVGQDPKFGARPMNRAIQEKVEQKIAEKMLKGELSAGSRVELTANELR